MRLKTAAKVLGGTLGEIVSLPPGQLEIEAGFNPRDPASPHVAAHIREIANSIVAHGYDQTQAIIVRWTGERAIVRDGHCRLHAIRLAVSEGATVDRVPVMTMPRATNEVDDAYQVLTTQNKLALTPLEFAAQVAKLIRQGQTTAEIARRLGKAPGTIDAAITLAEAPADIRGAVEAGNIRPTVAVRAIRAEGAQAGATIAAARTIAKDRGATRATDADLEAARTKRAAAEPEYVRTAPISVHTLALEAARAWQRNSPSHVLRAAMDALCEKLGVRCDT